MVVAVLGEALNCHLLMSASSLFAASGRPSGALAVGSAHPLQPWPAPSWPVSRPALAFSTLRVKASWAHLWHHPLEPLVYFPWAQAQAQLELELLCRYPIQAPAQ